MTTKQSSLMKYTSYLLVGLLLLILSTACQGTNTTQGAQHIQETTSTQGIAPTNVETEQKHGTESELSTENQMEATQEEQQAQQTEKKYAVNPHNYLIHPVNHEEDKVVLLTFDDTPTSKATMAILDTLDKYEAKAIFFVNGHYAQPNVELLKEIAERGHLIGNHTWWHKYLRKEDPETVREEIIALNDFIEEQLGERPKFFRPPFGQHSEVSRQVITEEGMQTMNWSNGSLDWELKSPEAITEQVISNLKPGDNILFHDKQITADALDEILSHITAQGYHFVLPTEVLPAEIIVEK